MTNADQLQQRPTEVAGRRTVMHIILTNEMAGTERHVADLCTGLRELGWRTLIVVRSDVAQAARAAFERSAELRVLPARPFPFLVPALAQLARAERVSLLHGHLGNGSFAALGASRLAGVPAVSTIHIIQLRHTLLWAAWLLRPIYRLLIRQMSAVIVVSGAVEASTRAIIGHHGPPLLLIRHGIAVDPADSSTWPSERMPIILFAGRFDSEKQPDLLIRAAAELKGDFQLWLAGRGQMEAKLRRLADELLPGRHRFLGFVPDLAPYFQQARILAIPSRDEAFGLVALEAMRASRPVVAFADGAMPEIVVDGETGLLVPPFDATAFAAKLQVLVDDDERARELGRAGLERVKAEFTLEQMANATARAYATVLGTPELPTGVGASISPPDVETPARDGLEAATPRIADSALLTRNPRVVHRNLPDWGGAVLLHLDTGLYHSLNPIGSLVWSQLENEIEYATLLSQMRGEFSDPPPSLAEDLASFIQELAKEGLVVLRAQDGGGDDEAPESTSRGG